ncbi:cytochrome c [Roseiarcus fermentans]|uniref:Cytochrome c n=1 Tax=Roseiarcus fermentans TaxID=1473586 RepID=A0A366FU84_9HYPH|nr:cytochrome c family protein [Roseiarcus fermentans]RBP17295.1 cytochrome c [Roseiarcus fermentans]
MASLDFNRTMLAFFGALVFYGVIVEFTSLVFMPWRTERPGYALPGSAPAAAVAAAPAAAKEPPLPELLAKADAGKGAADAKICATCHSFEKGGPAKIGPNLWGVVGRPVASAPGFAYSDAVKSLGGDWTYDKLNGWIGNPKGMAAGTKMAFAGEKEPQKRADILAYLQSLSDSPVPFPK